MFPSVVFFLLLSFCRTRCQPPDELKVMIWPWIEDEISKVVELRSKRDTAANAGVTAHAFLVFLRHLRTVILQDAAAMICTYPERSGHVFFRHEVFDSELFHDFKRCMQQELRKEIVNERVAVDEAMPGVNRQFDEVLLQIDEQQKATFEIKKMVRDVEGKLCGLGLQMARGFRSAAESIEADVSHEQEEQQQQRERGQLELPGVSGLAEARGIRIQERFENVNDMKSCWEGTGRYKDIMWPGGIKALEEQFGGKWRQHFSAAEKQRFSRFKRVVVAATENNNIHEYQRAFEHNNRGLFGAVQYGQQMGQIEVAKRRSNGPPAP